jgi:hypothetical protein
MTLKGKLDGIYKEFEFNSLSEVDYNNIIGSI